MLKGAPPLRRSVAPRTAAYAHETLYLALKQSATDGIVARNIAADVAPPKVPKTKARAFTAAEVERLLASCEGDWHTLWLLALYTGMRLGELLGLPWDALVQDVGDGTREGEVTVRQVLAEGEHGGLVFVSRFGTFLLRSNVIRAFKRECAAARPAIAGPVNPHLVPPHVRVAPLRRAPADHGDLLRAGALLAFGDPGHLRALPVHRRAGDALGARPQLPRRGTPGAGRRRGQPAAGDPLPAQGVGSDRQGP